MTTALNERTAVEYPIADIAIEQLAHDYLPLQIDGAQDAAGYKAVRAARLVVKSKRIEIEKTRKALKADAIAYGRLVDGEAKRLVGLLAPVEEHLTAEEEAYNAEREAIKRAEEEAKQQRLKAWVARFAEVGESRLTFELDGQTDAQLEAEHQQVKAAFDEQQAAEKAERQRREAEEKAAVERTLLASARHAQLVTVGYYADALDELGVMSDGDFAALLAAATATHQEKVQAEAEAADERKAEEARLAAERAEVEKVREAQRVEAERLAEVQRKQEAAEAERQRLAELEAAKAKAAEDAKREAEATRQREAAEAQARADAEESERQRVEALRPDHEKLLAVAKAVEEIATPEVSASAADVASEIRMLLADTAARIRAAANRLA